MKLIIACDFSSGGELNRLLNHFPSSTKLILKIGWELILSTSLHIVEKLKQQGHQVMLDLKLHDIPNTIIKTLAVIQSVKPDWITVNLAAGPPSVAAAVKACANTTTKVVGITYLTSLSDYSVQTISNNRHNLVTNLKHLVNCGLEWGVHRFVCAGPEAAIVKKLHPTAETFCPGVTNQPTDQVRTSNEQLDQKNIDYLIAGRIITTVEHPDQIYHKLLILNNIN